MSYRGILGNPNNLPGLGPDRLQRQQQPQSRGLYAGFTSNQQTAAAPAANASQAGRLDALEKRLQAMENNSRAMINQFSQIQQETQVGLRRNGHGVMEQREARGRLEMALRAAQQKLTEMDYRMGRTSTSLKDTESSLHSLSVQTKNMQNALMVRGKDSGELAADRMHELRAEVEELAQYHDLMRRNTAELKEGLQDLRMKTQTVSGDVQAISQSVRLQEEMIDDGKRAPVRDGRRGFGDPAIIPSLEGKIVRLQQSLKDVESKMTHLSKKSELIQTQQNTKINDVASAVGKSKNSTDDALRELQRRSEPQFGALTDSELNQVQQDIDRVRQKLDAVQNDKKDAERDTSDFLAQLKALESSLQNEAAARTAREAGLRTEVQKKLEEMTAYGDQGLEDIKKINETDHQLTQKRFRELSEGLELLEKCRDADEGELEKLLEEQREQRRKLDREMDDRVDDIGDRLRIGMASLQAAQRDIKPGETRPAGLSLEEVERLQNMNGEGAREQLAKALAETESQLSALSTRVEQQDEVIEAKLKMAERSDSNEDYLMGDQVAQKLDSVAFTQERLKRQVHMLEDKVQECPRDLTEERQRLEKSERELIEKLEKMKRERTEEVERLKKDVAEKETSHNQLVKKMAEMEGGIEDTQTSVTKLNEAMLSVKRTVGDKVKEGKRKREDDLYNVKRGIDRLNEQTWELKDMIKHPKDYIY